MRQKRGWLAGFSLLLCLSGCGEGQNAVVPAFRYVQEEELAEIPEEEPQPEAKAEPAEPVKGIYVTGPIAGHERMGQLEELAASSELNAMVIDIKNDEGIVTYQIGRASCRERV